MPDLYLHIGSPKTGSSSIQVFLRDNARPLEDMGYYVPQIGQGRAGGHHTLVRTLVGLPVPPHQTVAESDILKELAQAGDRSILISSEMLTGILTQADQADTLLRKLRGNGTRVIFIFYVRNQTQWLNSAYSQGVKSFRHADGFPQYVSDVLSNAHAYGFNKWISIAERLGVELRVQPFTKEVRNEGVMGSYLRLIGLAAPHSFELPARVNESAGPFTVEAARRLLAWVPGGVEGLTFMQSTRCKLALGREIEQLGINEGSYCGLDTKKAAEVEAAFADANDRFASAVWGSSWSNIFRDDIGQKFVSNDYSDTGIPSAMSEPLQEVITKLQAEIAVILKNPRLSARTDWNARRA